MRPSSTLPSGGAQIGSASLSTSWVRMNASAPAGSIPCTIRTVNVPASSLTRAAFSGCANHLPTRSGMPAPITLSVMVRALRKFSLTNSLSTPATWSFLFGMMAVCGMGMPMGYRKSAVTANQSASPPTMPASAAART